VVRPTSGSNAILQHDAANFWLLLGSIPGVWLGRLVATSFPCAPPVATPLFSY
jgi:hypothetical protein